MNKVNINKILYISLFILLVFNVIIFINYFIDKNSSYVILNSNNIIKINNNKVSIYKKKYQKLNYSSAKLYNGEDVIDGYIKIKEDSKTGYTNINFYKKSMELADINDSIIVIGDNKITDYTNLMSNSISNEDSKIISKFLKDNSIGKMNDLTEATVTKINGGKIYTARTLDFNNEDYNYSTIFSKIGDNYQLLFKSKGKEIFNKMSSLNKVVDLNNDNNADLILETAPFGTDVDYCYSVFIYDKSKNNYNPVINCEED